MISITNPFFEWWGNRNSNAILRQEVGYGWARELSSIRVLGLESGHFRALPRPEALCFGAFWRLGPRKGQGGGSTQGLNRMGAGIGGDQMLCRATQATLSAH